MRSSRLALFLGLTWPLLPGTDIRALAQSPLPQDSLAQIIKADGLARVISNYETDLEENPTGLCR